MCRRLIHDSVANENCWKESDVGIIRSILGKREPVIKYRTVDGGHPAPFPDMTDEQLYNYEVAFNVPRKTFDKPPVSARPEPTAEKSAEKEESEEKSNEKVFDAPRYSARAASEQIDVLPMKSKDMQALDLSRPVRLVTTKQPVEIITTRARHPVYKVHGYIDDDNVVTVFTLDGQLSENGPRFLENVPEQQELHLNIYRNPDRRSKDRFVVTQHATRDDADSTATAERLVCVAVQFDV